LAIVFLSTRFAVYDFAFQYNYYLLPFIFLATADFLGAMAVSRNSVVGFIQTYCGRHRIAISFVLLMTAIVHNAHYGQIIQPSVNRIRFGTSLSTVYSSDDQRRYERISAVLSRIPPLAKIGASETLAPHLARRRYLYRVSEPSRTEDIFVVWKSDTSDLTQRLGPFLSEKYTFVQVDPEIDIYVLKDYLNRLTEQERTRLLNPDARG